MTNSRVAKFAAERSPYRVILSVLLMLLVLPLSVFASSDATSGSSSTSALDNSSATKTILVMGDSLSAAYKLSASDGWVHLLEQRLTSHARPYRVVNASVSGATSAAGLQLLPQSLAKHSPDIVILELGANDGLQGKPVPYITENLRRLIRMIRKEGADVLLLGVHLPPNMGSRYTKPFFAQYARLAEQEAVGLVPFLMDGVAGHPELMLDDGLHPKAEGQKILLDNVWHQLEPML